MIPEAAPISIAVTSPEESDARAVLRAYYDDIASRYYGRQATDAEIDSALAAEPSDDLRLPHGSFWVARASGEVVGCAGLRLRPAGIGEVTRVFVARQARRRGLGSRLLTEVERAARTHGRSLLRLDTRHDLVEARRLYATHGFREVPALNDDPYAEHWFAKDLA
jgi:ribosomal protein S18 acetylase RimI-like enzyme